MLKMLLFLFVWSVALASCLGLLFMLAMLCTTNPWWLLSAPIFFMGIGLCIVGILYADAILN